MVRSLFFLTLLYFIYYSIQIMSRLIIKNLPKDLSDEKFRTHFATKGEVTDARLMRTSSGQSRRFGFIGYRSDQVAEAALNHFNGTFINTSKIVVEKAIPYGADNIPRGWSKYTEGTSAHARLSGTNKIKSKSEFQVEETDAFRLQKEKLLKHINQLKGDEQDPKLREYLDVMTSRSKGQTWTNDNLATLQSYTNSKLGTDDTPSVVATITSNDPDDDLYDDLPSNKNDQEADKTTNTAASSTEDDGTKNSMKILLWMVTTMMIQWKR
ncbi:unnamed protein product [Absidia cylindrospora]